MSSRVFSLRTAFIAMAGLFGVAGLVLMLAAPDPEKIATAGLQSPLREIQLIRIEREAVQSTIEVSAVLEPRRSVRIFSETRGPILEIGAEALDRVEEGQLLVRIDPLQAEVAVQRASANRARSRSELALARSNLKRRQSLSQRNVTSAAELENAENQESVALASLRQSDAELKQARDDLENKAISASFSGVLRSFDAELGEYVQDGQELGELLDLSTARVVIGLSDSEVVAVKAGQAADIDVEALPDEAFSGEVLRVGAASDPQTRRFPVEIEVPNPGQRLLPGMMARVRIDLEEERLRTLVPREVTIDEFGLRFVWVVEPKNGGDVQSGAGGDAEGGQGEWVVRRRRVGVRPLPFRPADFEVVSGLEVGERVAVSSVRQLQDGETVRVSGGSAP